MLKDLQLEDPMPIIREGNWTVDAMNELVNQAGVDLNGNTEIDARDRFGIVCDSGRGFQAFVNACNNILITKDKNNIPQIISDTNHLVDSIDKVLEMMTDERAVLYCDRWNGKASYSYWLTASPFYSQTEAKTPRKP